MMIYVIWVPTTYKIIVHITSISKKRVPTKLLTSGGFRGFVGKSESESVPSSIVGKK